MARLSLVLTLMLGTSALAAAPALAQAAAAGDEPPVLAREAPATPAAADAGKPDPGELWKQLREPLTGVLENQEDPGWLRAIRPGRGEALLNDAVEILAVGRGVQLRDEIRSRQARITELRGQVSEWRLQVPAAPPASDGAMGQLSDMMRTTRTDLEAKIATAEQEIAENETQLGILKTEFRASLEKLGIKLEGAQVDGLLAMATGDDLVSLYSVYDNLRSVNQTLLHATIAADESIETAKRYYGLYTVMVQLALHMHQEFLGKVDEQYLPKLEEIVAQTRTLKAETEIALLNESDARRRTVLERNLAAQDLNLKVGEIYRQRLIDQRAQIEGAMAPLEAELATAQNTLKTVQSSSAILSMMRSSGEGFAVLMQIEIPPLRPFENQDMQRAFEDLTRTLQGPGT
ncbi:hypothetical protein [Zavarzinia sp. CC-PAN008]|uniref:hypothetical protein n=1 Tax=Zavarzinia sp. CC-PAN008 TaxID=3243332 RepID=UPI003F742AB3